MICYITDDFIEINVDDPTECYKLLLKLPEPNKTLLNWLLDLMVDVVMHEKENAMNSTNVGV